MTGFAWLAAAICAEVAGTLALKGSVGMTRPVPAVLVVVGYGLAFWFLSQSLRELPVAIAYAAWAGVGTAAIGLLGWLVYGETLHAAAIVGLVMVAAGATLLAAYSDVP